MSKEVLQAAGKYQNVDWIYTKKEHWKGYNVSKTKGFPLMFKFLENYSKQICTYVKTK